VDRLALGDGTVAEVAGERALDHLAAHVHVGELRGRGEHDAVGVLDVDGGDGDGVADLHAGVRASVRVDEDGSFWGVRAAGPHLRDRGALTADLDGVAAEEAEPLSGGFGEPGDAPARVPLLGGTHREPEAGGVVHTLRSGHSPFTLTRHRGRSRCRRARDPSAADRNPLPRPNPSMDMQPTGHLRGDAVHVAGDARQRFHDSNGYGRPLGGNEIALSRVETAHLLFRGDLSGVSLTPTPTPSASSASSSSPRPPPTASRYATSFTPTCATAAYLPRPPASRGPAATSTRPTRSTSSPTSAVRRPTRGREVPRTGRRRARVAAGGRARGTHPRRRRRGVRHHVLRGDARGDRGCDRLRAPDQLDGVLLSDRVVVWDAPEGLYERGFYGQPLTGRAAAVEGAVQLSLVEAASLAADGVLSLSTSVGTAGESPARAPQRRTVPSPQSSPAAATWRASGSTAGSPFISASRAADAVPKTGFKFGADFRTYLDVETVEDLPHSEHLVRVVEGDHRFSRASSRSTCGSRGASARRWCSR